MRAPPRATVKRFVIRRTKGPRRRATLPQAEPADAETLFGESVGRYLLLSKLGHGGHGEVFSAYDPLLDRKVAIKLLHAGDGRSEAS